MNFYFWGKANSLTKLQIKYLAVIMRSFVFPLIMKILCMVESGYDPCTCCYVLHQNDRSNLLPSYGGWYQAWEDFWKVMGHLASDLATCTVLWGGLSHYSGLDKENGRCRQREEWTQAPSMYNLLFICGNTWAYMTFIRLLIEFSKP